MNDPVPGLGDEPHRMDEQIAGDRLDDVLDELAAVGLQSPPLTTSRDTAVGDGGAAPPVLTKPRLHIGQLPPRGQLDEEDARLLGEGEVA